jgi:hypothetical protein
MKKQTKSVVQPKALNGGMKKMVSIVKHLKNASTKPLTVGYVAWLLLVLSTTIVAPSLVAISAKTCASGSFSLKLWEFEYTLVKSGNCDALPEQALP